MNPETKEKNVVPAILIEQIVSPSDTKCPIADEWFK